LRMLQNIILLGIPSKKIEQSEAAFT
jgi:hypothetical protein